MDVDIERVVKTVHNVVGYLPGETNEYIVIGAHYDHLGLGGQFSLAPRSPEPSIPARTTTLPAPPA